LQLTSDGRSDVGEDMATALERQLLTGEQIQIVGRPVTEVKASERPPVRKNPRSR